MASWLLRQELLCFVASAACLSLFYLIDLDAELGDQHENTARRRPFGISLYVNLDNNINRGMEHAITRPALYFVATLLMVRWAIRMKHRSILVALLVATFVVVVAHWCIQILAVPAVAEDSFRVSRVSTMNQQSGALKFLRRGNNPRKRIPPHEFRRQYRLGNLVDRWWVASLNDTKLGKPLTKAQSKTLGDAQGTFRGMAVGSPDASFGHFLLHHKPVETPSARLSDEFWNHASWWWLYFYSSMRESPEFGHSLREALEQYSLTHGLQIPLYDPKTCLVHYRLGDVLSPEYGTLDPEEMANSLFHWAKSKNLSIAEFHVLASGNLVHGTGDGALVGTSQAMLHVLCETLRTLFPNSTVNVDTGGNPDEDFAKMVLSPMLFTSHGSFATAALMANSGEKASPACSNLNFPGFGSIPEGYFSDNWYLYRFKKANSTKFFTNKILWDPSDSTWQA